MTDIKRYLGHDSDGSFTKSHFINLSLESELPIGLVKDMIRQYDKCREIYSNMQP